MKNLMSFICLLTMVSLSGCTQEEMLGNAPTASDGRVFTTSFENNESRTYLENGLLARWTAGDRISLFDGNSLNREYQFDGKTGDNAGTFSMVNNTYGTGTELKTNYAVYPYAEDVKITSDGVITTTLPAQQHYAENSYGLGDNTMVAVTHNIYDTFLKFKNVGSCIKLQLYGDDVTVKSITLTGNNGEKIAGKANITVAYDKAPVVSMADDATTSITLDCGEGVKIGATQEEATTFWMTLPPVTFEKGITVTVTDIKNQIFVQSTPKQLVIERNVVKPMAAVETKTDVPYLTFAAGAIQELSMSKAVETLEYSVNGGAWNELGENTVEFGGELGVLRLRGKNLNGTAGSNYNDYSSIDFKNSDVLVACYGDIRTLLDYQKYATADTKDARFRNLFYKCAQLTSAPQLPATNLADLCYQLMFYDCWRLTEAPELPATTLADKCYANMFSHCSGLTKAPELPATTMTNQCYSSMFSGCTSLIQAPELPAMNLAEACYSSMFNECSSLKQAPELPATTLADRCYRGMFTYCTNLTKAPELPATTMVNQCYNGMFSDCTSLIQAPKLPAMNLAYQCYDQMFDGCLSLAEAPELPATTLAKECYQSMFFRCHNLTKAPQLPATTLALGCYDCMFSYCENLTEAPELPAITLAAECYASMFNHCYNLVKAPELPATVLEYRCYDGMFHTCTSMTEAPVLPAKTLAYGCYSRMFMHCEKLAHITMLATNISAKECLDRWATGVAPTGTFIKSKEMENPTNGWGIPEGWTVENY